MDRNAKPGRDVTCCSELCQIYCTLAQENNVRDKAVVCLINQKPAATLADETQFLIGNELTRSDNPGNLRPVAQTATRPSTDRMIELLERYAGLPEALKEQPDVRYCAGRAYITIGQADAARNELRRSLELAGGRDADARDLLQALEATLTFSP